jgi:hypothetical protein
MESGFSTSFSIYCASELSRSRGAHLSKYKCRTHEIRMGGPKNVEKLIIINKALFRNEFPPHTPPPYPGPPLAPGAAPSGPCLLRAKTRAEPRKKTAKESVKNAGCTPTFSCETFILGNKPGCTAHPCNSQDTRKKEEKTTEAIYFAFKKSPSRKIGADVRGRYEGHSISQK